MSEELVAPLVEMMRAEGLTPDDLAAAFEAGGTRPRTVKRHIKLVGVAVLFPHEKPTSPS